jgi:Holliday junction resolvase RusA-like endonuclease
VNDHVLFLVPGVAVGKGRAKVGRAGPFVRMYTPKKTKDYEGTVAWYARTAMGSRPPITGPCAVMLSVSVRVPTSWSKAEQRAALAGDLWPTGKPDIDNTVKALFDAMNGIVWVDDAQACVISAHKRYMPEPGVLVHVVPLGQALESPLFSSVPAASGV